ncbi:MAG: hypothetical protein ACYDH6_24060 [Acidimicrobiales bacterium]
MLIASEPSGADPHDAVAAPRRRDRWPARTLVALRGCPPRRVLLGAGALAYVALRVTRAVGVRPAVTPDSLIYLAPPGLHGRPPLVPAVFALLGHQLRVITLVHGVLSALCWLALAGVAVRLCKGRGARYLAGGGLLALGTCDAVARWDTAIGSDSLSLSLGVALVAASLWAAQRSSVRRVAVVAVLALLWSLARDSNSLVLGVAGVGGLAIASGGRRPWSWTAQALPMIFVAIFVLGQVSVSAGRRWQQSFDNVVGVRVLTDPARTRCFEAHGMPVAVEAMRGRYVVDVKTDPFVASPALARYRRWQDRSGRTTFVRCVLRDLGWALTAPFRTPETLSGPRGDPPLSSYGSPAFQAIVPAEIQSTLFTDRNAPLVVETAFVLAVVVAAVLWRGSVPRSWWLPLAILVLAVPHGVIAWHADTIEVGRHALQAAVELRIGLVLVAALSIDALLRAAAPTHTATSSSGDAAVT